MSWRELLSVPDCFTPASEAHTPGRDVGRLDARVSTHRPTCILHLHLGEHVSAVTRSKCCCGCQRTLETVSSLQSSCTPQPTPTNPRLVQHLHPPLLHDARLHVPPGCGHPHRHLPVRPPGPASCQRGKYALTRKNIPTYGQRRFVQASNAFTLSPLPPCYTGAPREGDGDHATQRRHRQQQHQQPWSSFGIRFAFAP